VPSGLLRIAGRVIAPIFPADMLRPGLVCWLLLPFLISHNALLRPASIGLWHTGLSTVLAAHVLPTYQIICFRHLDLSFPVLDRRP
jgi:hypothetical protein